MVNNAVDLGFINIADGTTMVDIGGLNVTDSSTAQLGFINIAQNGFFPVFPFFNFPKSDTSS